MEYGGCGDHSCRCVKPKGMGTNGGCRCHDDRDRAKKAISFLANKVAALEKALKQAQPVPTLPTTCGSCGRPLYTYCSVCDGSVRK